MICPLGCLQGGVRMKTNDSGIVLHMKTKIAQDWGRPLSGCHLDAGRAKFTTREMFLKFTTAEMTFFRSAVARVVKFLHYAP